MVTGSLPSNRTCLVVPALVAAPGPPMATCTSLTTSGAFPNTFEILILISLPPTLVCTMSRTVWRVNPVADRPVAAGCT
jgi:hypothetical protein